MKNESHFLKKKTPLRKHRILSQCAYCHFLVTSNTYTYTNNPHSNSVDWNSLHRPYKYFSNTLFLNYLSILICFEKEKKRNVTMRWRTVGQIPPKCKETLNLMWLSLIWFILVLFVCWNLFCTIANIRIKCVTETKKISLLLNQAFLHDSHIWLWGFFTLLAALAHGAAAVAAAAAYVWCWPYLVCLIFKGKRSSGSQCILEQNKRPLGRPRVWVRSPKGQYIWYTYFQSVHSPFT